MNLILSKRTWCILAVAALALALPHTLLAAGPTVLVVSVDPLNPTFPHTTYATSGTTEISVVLGATVPSAVGSSDAFTYSWSFGDGSAPTAAAAVTNPYDISVTHQYPASATPGTAWQAVVTVTDTTTSTKGTATYYVTQELNNLNSRVNVAIDWGLWYMHQTMWRNSTTVGAKNVNWGGWDTQTYACPTVNGGAYDCDYYGVINAQNVQAFEVSGHLGNGPASDPYTDDVARGTARLTNFLASEAVLPTVYQYDPSKASYTCADNSIPQTTDAGACTGHGGQHQYNAGATSCPAPPCSVTYDGNSNGLMIYSNDGSGEYSYTTSPFLDALIASGTPNAVATTGPVGVLGASYKTIVQDILDFYGYSQYGYDYDVSLGYTRGYGGSDQGGAWLYGPQQGDDNSTSQWAAIGYISGARGFGINTPKSVTDFNNVWVTNSQDVQEAAPTGADPYLIADLGAFGYRGSFYYSNAWGAFAVTPSGMVQMAMDGIGRTKNTTFGDATSDFDQRWNNTETYYADNFCNTNASGYYNPKQYAYGLYSFTKAMLLHDPSGSLSPIQFLRTQTPGVFPGNASTTPPAPVNTIDWYAAVSPANGGTDVCDGIAQTLVGYQLTPNNGTFDGHWYGNNYDDPQNNFETAWAIIMLRKTVFVTCINNLQGRGTPKGLSAARIDLTWSGQTNATSYNVLRSSTNGGPYVQIGTSTLTAYSDRTGLVNNGTYYYVVQPVNGTNEICQSNQATVIVP